MQRPLEGVGRARGGGVRVAALPRALLQQAVAHQGVHGRAAQGGHRPGPQQHPCGPQPAGTAAGARDQPQACSRRPGAGPGAKRREQGGVWPAPDLVKMQKWSSILPAPAQVSPERSAGCCAGRPRPVGDPPTGRLAQQWGRAGCSWRTTQAAAAERQSQAGSGAGCRLLQLAGRTSAPHRRNAPEGSVARCGRCHCALRLLRLLSSPKIANQGHLADRGEGPSSAPCLSAQHCHHGAGCQLLPPVGALVVSLIPPSRAGVRPLQGEGQAPLVRAAVMTLCSRAPVPAGWPGVLVLRLSRHCGVLPAVQAGLRAQRGHAPLQEHGQRAGGQDHEGLCARLTFTGARLGWL